MKEIFPKEKISAAASNLYLDILLLIGFILIMEPELTGITIHEWFSLAFGAAMVIHIIWHWKWVVALTKKLFEKLFHLSRLRYFLGLVLLGAFLFVFVTGIMESQSLLRFFGLKASRNPIWEWLHSLSSDLMWFLVGVHILLDWKWILNATQRYILRPLHKRR